MDIHLNLLLATTFWIKTKAKKKIHLKSLLFTHFLRLFTESGFCYWKIGWIHFGKNFTIHHHHYHLFLEYCQDYVKFFFLHPTLIDWIQQIFFSKKSKVLFLCIYFLYDWYRQKNIFFLCEKKKRKPDEHCFDYDDDTILTCQTISVSCNNQNIFKINTKWYIGLENVLNLYKSI